MLYRLKVGPSVCLCLSLPLSLRRRKNNKERFWQSSKVIGFTEQKKKKKRKSISGQLEVCSELYYVQVCDQLYTGLFNWPLLIHLLQWWTLVHPNWPGTHSSTSPGFSQAMMLSAPKSAYASCIC